MDRIDLAGQFVRVGRGPCGVAALHGEIHSGRHRDARRAAIFIFSDERPHLELLVHRRRRHGHRRLVCRQDERIFMPVGGKGRGQRPLRDLKPLQPLVIIAPNAAKVRTHPGRGVHHADLIPVLKRSVRGSVLVEAVIREPVVQCAHPAGIFAVPLLGHTVDLRNIALVRTDGRIARAFQRPIDAAHHGHRPFERHPYVEQRAAPCRRDPVGRSVGLRIGRVLHSYVYARRCVRAECRRREQSQQQHRRKQQRQQSLRFLHTFLLLFLVYHRLDSPNMIQINNLRRFPNGKRRAKQRAAVVPPASRSIHSASSAAKQ